MRFFGFGYKLAAARYGQVRRTGGAKKLASPVLLYVYPAETAGSGHKKKAVPKDSLSIEFKIVRMIIFQQPILLHPVLSAWQ